MALAGVYIVLYSYLNPVVFSEMEGKAKIPFRDLLKNGTEPVERTNESVKHLVKMDAN